MKETDQSNDDQGDVNQDTTTLLDKIGSDLVTHGDLHVAKPYWEQALAIRMEVLGDKHPETATSMNNMGYLLHALGDLQGQCLT